MNIIPCTDSRFIRSDFINNAFASMLTLNSMGDRKQLNEALVHLSRLFHYLHDAQKNVLLSYECTFIQHYIFLQKLRFGGRIHFDLSIRNFEKVLIKKYSLFRIVESIMRNYIETAVHPGSLSVVYSEDKNIISVLYQSEEYRLKENLRIKPSRRQLFLFSLIRNPK